MVKSAKFVIPYLILRLVNFDTMNVKLQLMSGVPNSEAGLRET